MVCKQNIAITFSLVQESLEPQLSLHNAHVTKSQDVEWTLISLIKSYSIDVKFGASIQEW